MTKSELKEMLKQLGERAESVAGEIMEKVEAEKAELDKETRREVRKFWIFVSVLCLFLGYGLSFIF